MSSDSEDDCYGNVAQHLQKLKNQYHGDKIESVQLLNESSELDEIVRNNPTLGRKKRTSFGRKKPDASLQNQPKRATRSSKRSSTGDSELLMPPLELLPPTRRRNATSNTTRNATVNASTDSVPTTSEGGRGRGGRGRGRGGRGRGRGRQRVWRQAPPPRRPAPPPRRPASPPRRPNRDDFVDPNIPTYSVGNTDEYPDQSDNQVLFSNKNQTTLADVVVLDDDNVEENEVFNVKVYWTSSEYYKFSIRRYQKLSQIFRYFAEKENIGYDKLLFTLNGKILKPDDTPDSIGYTISKIIDGGIVEQGVSDLMTRKDRARDGIKLKFQCQTLKKPFELVIKPDDKFSLTMVKVAEHLEMPLEKLKFEFDGDSISG